MVNDVSDATIIIKSLIISQKDGILLSSLNSDYKKIIGKDIPYDRSEHKTLESYLLSLPDVTIDNGVVKASSANTSNLQKLIERQKSNGIKKKMKKQKDQQKKMHRVINSTSMANIKEMKLNYQSKISQPNSRTYQQSWKDLNTPIQYCSDEYQLTDDFFIGSSDIHFSQHHTKVFNFMKFLCDNQPDRQYTMLFNQICGFIDVDRNNLYNCIFKMCSHFVTKMKLSSIKLSEFFPKNSFVQKIIRNMQITSRGKKYTRKIDDFFIGEYQVIGDNCLTKLAIEYFGKRKSILCSRMCSPCLSIEEAMKRFSMESCAPSVLIVLGTYDFYAGGNIGKAINDMQHFILCIILSGRKLAVCLLPPSPMGKINSYILAFNLWLSSQTAIHIVDLYSTFLGRNNFVIHEMFERYPICVNGYPYFLWSMMGHDAIAQRLLSALC